MKNVLPDDTKQRIMDAALEVFAREGFKRGTIREIAKLAGVNVAAINYHFGDKKNLYSVIAEQWIARANELFAKKTGNCCALSPEAQLKSLIVSVLTQLLLDSGSSGLGRLFNWEFTMEPTELLGKLIDGNMAPVAEEFNILICHLLGDACDPELTRMYTMNIVAQCVYLYTHPVVAKRLFKIEVKTKDDIERLAEHITRFSLDAITMERERLKQSPFPPTHAE